MSPLEIIGTALGFANIILLIRRSIWNFPVAMAMVTCIFFVLFEARLYAEAGLQIFFFAVNAYGWVLWHRAKGAGAGTIPVAWLGWGARAAWLAGMTALSLTLGLVLDHHTDAALPYADSAVAGMSVAAQFLLSFRRIENWLLWIAVDVLSLIVYTMRELPLLALLYVAFGLLSAVGLRSWTEAART